MIAKVRAGEEIEMPLPVVRRLRDLGRDETDWLAGRNKSGDTRGCRPLNLENLIT